MKVLSPSLAANGVSRCEIVSKRNLSNTNKVIEPRTKFFNHHQQQQQQQLSANSVSATKAINGDKHYQTRRLLDFIQKQKSNSHDQRTTSKSTTTANGKTSSPQKPINEIRNGYERKAAAQIEVKSKPNAAHPFVPSKRIIQHHDYQNLVDDTKTASPSSSTATPRNRYNNYTYDSIFDGESCVDKNNINNNNRRINECERTKTPIYRHFGDTNVMRSKGKIHYNEMNNNCANNVSLAIGIEPSIPNIDKHQKLIKCTAYPAEMKQNSSDHRQRNDVFPNSYVTSNLTNDTGFASIDTDPSSIVRSKSNNNNFHLPFHCVNYNVKNRIKMFDVDPSSYRKLANNKIHEKR